MRDRRLEYFLQEFEEVLIITEEDERQEFEDLQEFQRILEIGDQCDAMNEWKANNI